MRFGQLHRVKNIYVVSQFGIFALASFTIFTRVTCTHYYKQTTH